MSYQTYNIIAIILLCLLVLFLLMTMFMFFYFKIISVIGDLSGSTAKKHIDRIRKENISSGDKKFRPSPINVDRGKITEKMSKGLDVPIPNKGETHFTNVLSKGTQLLSTQTDHPPYLNFAQVGETIILAGEDTESLPEGIMEGASAGTTVLHADDGQIRPNATDRPDETDQRDERSEVFEVVRSVMFIHTAEVIP